MLRFMRHQSVLGTVFRVTYKKALLSSSRLLAVLVLLAFSSLSQATIAYKTIYKSTGEFGEVKYSQFQPNPDTQAEIIQMRSDGRPSQPGLFAGHSIEDQSLTNQTLTNQSSSNQGLQNKTAKSSSSQTTSKATQCQNLNNNLSSLKAGGEIYTLQNNGQRLYLNDIEVALKLQKTEKLLAQYCKAGPIL